MATVKTGLKNMSAPNRVMLARAVVSKMTGNAAFPAPVPSLGALGAAADALQSAANAAEVARAQARQATTVLAQREAALTALLVQEAAYVQNASAGDHATIQSSGFDVRNRAGRVGDLPAPTSLAVDVSGDPGAMAFRWKGVKGAMSYVLEIAPDAPELSWQAVQTSARPRALVNGLTSGARYWFRVAAVGAAGRGLWTATMSKFAP